ncbi:MAG: ABC transporter ATP-binding protein [Acidobacteria bacterium]|nr:MAG: ABC transporter ATP-binding protein [Acidobacteriota bacterium]
MPGVIELEGLSVRFGKVEALRNLSGSFSGRAIGLLGPNGAGKTTLIHTLLGFHRPSAGSARVFGHDVRRNDKAARALIGYMPERDSFIAGMSAVRFVRMMGELSGLPPAQALERAHEALFYVGLGEARYRMLETYSLGMKQRAKLAQALVHGPKLLFLDEPTNGLDPPGRERMIKLIKNVRDAGDVHVILSSHLLRDVEECCEEVLILKDGKIARYCNLEEERRANRKFLELEIAGDVDAYVAAVRTLGCESARAGKRRIKMVLPPELRIRELYRLAAEQRAQIRHLDYKKDSLQDIFLKAMDLDPLGDADHGRLRA